MSKLYFILFSLTLLILSCNSKNEIKKEDLIGSWVMVENISRFEPELDSIGEIPITKLSFKRPLTYGFSFTKDKFEFYNGFKNYDKATGEFNFKGTFTDYKIKNDSIYIKNPFNDLWEFKWKIKKILVDTLVITKNDTTYTKVKTNSNINFDQIVLSSSGCYGSCPIIDISIDNQNKIYFQGEGYVNPLGFYESKIDSLKTDYIFSKFGKANIEALLNNYDIGHTDDRSITTTFIKNGQIIKTIHDYGKAGPKDLIWAYIPLEYLYKQIELVKLDDDEPFYPKLHYFTFEKGSKILRLEKSESFFLWTEIKKSDVTTKKFKPIYSIGFRGNYTYWGADPNEERKHKYKIKKIESDGRFFKFSFENKKPVTYDLGYNFINRNFEETNFTEKTKYD